MNMTLVEVHCLIRPLKKHCLPPREDDQSQLFLTESKAGTVAPPRTVNIIHQIIIMNYGSTAFSVELIKFSQTNLYNFHETRNNRY